MAKYNMRNVPILYKDFDERVDGDFANMRKRFDSEIYKIEEELARYRSELLDNEGKFLPSALITDRGQNKQNITIDGKNPSKIRVISQPSIQSVDKQKTMKIRFDTSDYAPGEVNVKADGKKLAVLAKYKQKIGNKTIYKESKREISLPKGVKPESIRPTMSRNGVLTVDAPLPNATLPIPSKR